jgi:hypothetical protein
MVGRGLAMAWLWLVDDFSFFVNAASLVSPWWWNQRGWLVLVGAPRWCFGMRRAPFGGGVVEETESFLLP